MSRFAEGTVVSVQKSKTEIEALIKKYKASGYISGYGEGKAFVMFMLENRCIRFNLRLPSAGDETFSRVKGRNMVAAIEQEERRLWRSLLLVIKAKLESAESGIETIDEAFLAQTVMPNGQTVGQWSKENLQDALVAGKMPQIPMLSWKEPSV
jgi:hypothetical protein